MDVSREQTPRHLNRAIGATSRCLHGMRIESSIITSLSELRAIEQQRIADERAAIDRERTAALDAARAAELARVEAEQARVRAEREERMRIETMRAEAERDARLRVEAHEAGERARLAAQLEERRMAAEMDLRRAEVAKKRPTWMLVVTGLAAAAAVGLTLFAVDASRTTERAQEKQQLALAEKETAKSALRDVQARMAALQADIDEFDVRLGQLQDQLIHAQSKADRDRVAKEIASAAADKRDKQKQLAANQAAAEKAARNVIIDVKGCTDTALGCLKMSKQP